MNDSIITDVSILNKMSQEVDVKNKGEWTDISTRLLSFKNNLGVAAPQIGVHSRIFLARLSTGTFIFINPKIVWKSPDQTSSIEQCLSLPNITRCVNRHTTIKVEADLILDSNLLTETPCDGIRLRFLDSFIFQHEYDHLEGVVLTDHPEVETREQKARTKQQKRQQKKQVARSLRNPSVSETQKKKKIKKRTIKEKKRLRNERLRLKKRVKLQELVDVRKKMLFEKQQSELNDTITQDEIVS